MSAPEADSTKRPFGGTRWLALALVASLAFNLAVVGAAVAERIWSEPRERGGSQRSFHLLPRAFFAELDRQRRDELRAVFQARRPEYRDERRALRDAAAAFADALGREPYDPSAVQAAIAEHASTSRRLADIGAAVAEDLVEALTPEERQELYEAIRHRIEEIRHSKPGFSAVQRRSH